MFYFISVYSLAVLVVCGEPLINYMPGFDFIWFVIK